MQGRARRGRSVCMCAHMCGVNLTRESFWGARRTTTIGEPLLVQVAFEGEPVSFFWVAYGRFQGWGYVAGYVWGGRWRGWGWWVWCGSPDNGPAFVAARM